MTYATELKLSLSNKRIPGRMHRWIIDYIMKGHTPGNFLCAVIENDPKGAVHYADQENKAKLPNYVSFFYNNAPSECWGSPKALKNWRGLNNQEQARG